MRISAREPCVKPHFTHGVMKKKFLASDVITLVKKKFFARVTYEILYHEV